MGYSDEERYQEYMNERAMRIGERNDEVEELIKRGYVDLGGNTFMHRETRKAGMLKNGKLIAFNKEVLEVL